MAVKTNAGKKAAGKVAKKSKPAYKRILLKLSGESLQGPGGFGIHGETIQAIAKELKEVHKLGVQIAIMVGGGNIFRGGRQRGFEIERATYANLTFFLPVLLGRLLMRLTRIRPASENNININALNGVFGRIFGAESSILRHVNLPFGVSAICVARRLE